MALIDLPDETHVPRRYRLTVGALAAVEAGRGPEALPLELLDGELFEMPPEGELHAGTKSLVMRALARNLPPEIGLAVEGPLKLSAFTAPRPDLFLTAGVANPASARGDQVLLVIEVADSSLAYDLGPKAEAYALGGVAEYWVVDLVNRVTHVHTARDGSGRWLTPLRLPAGAPLSPQAVPGWRFVLAEVLEALGV
jgi:Uma2 family endonuclease